MKKIGFFLLFCFLSFSALAEIVSDIQVKGNERLENKAIISYLPFQKGDDVSTSDLNKATKTLYKTGFFDDVNMRVKNKVLVILVDERPMISSISFEGNKKIKTETLEKELQIKVRDIYMPTKVKSDEERLKMIYQSMGLSHARVEAKVDKKTENRVNITFKIQEGDKQYIEDIYFKGNKRFSSSTLEEQLMSKSRRWYRFFTSTDTYDAARVDYDKELLRRFYFQNGYLDFEVKKVETKQNPKTNNFSLTFVLEEGKRYRVGKLSISTSLAHLNKKELNSQIVLREGKYYQADLLDKTIQKLVDDLGRQGYAFGEVEPIIKKDTQKDIVDITFKLKEGARIFVNEIDIQGNSRTLDKVIRREFRLAEGDAFNTEKVRRSRQRIENLGYFDKVDVQTKPVPGAPDKTDLAVSVSEKSTGSFNVGIGWSTYDGILFEVGVQERNFLGTGNIVGITASTSDNETQVDLSLTNPYFMDMPLMAGVDLYHIVRDYTDDSSYKSKTTGGALRFGWDYTERLSQTMKYSLYRDKVTDVDDDASLYIQKQKGTYLTSMLGTILTFDTRDSSINPTRGQVSSIGVDYAGIGADTHFIRTNFNATQYLELMDKWILSFHENAGIIHGLGEDVRINNAYFLGGYNLRGFESSGVGARDKATDDALGGNWIVTGRAQLMFPLGVPEELGLRGKVFVDAGTLGKPDDIDNWDDVWYSSKIRASYGIGLLWRSPMGPINIDFGFPFMKEKYDEREVFRLNFGTGF